MIHAVLLTPVLNDRTTIEPDLERVGSLPVTAVIIIVAVSSSCC